MKLYNGMGKEVTLEYVPRADYEALEAKYAELYIKYKKLLKAKGKG